MLSIEQACFEEDSWRAEDFRADHCIVAEINGKVVGFLVSREVFPGSATELPEREILNLAVSPAFRRVGVAKSLLQRELRHRAVFFLEVRESNVAGQKLYRLFGFKKIGRRPEFYSNPTETAIVMRMK